MGTTPAGQISTYPAWGGTQSALRAACVFEHNTTNDDTSAKFTLHDFKNAQWHNGAARTVTNTANIPVGATTFTATNCAGATGFVNRGITAPVGVTGIAARTFVTSISGACLVTLNKPTVTSIIPAGTSLKIESTSPRSVTDAAVTSGSTTVTSATANFTAADVGFSVSGTPIPLGVTIAAVTNATTITLSAAADGTDAAADLSFGGTLVSATQRTFNDATYSSTTTITSGAAKFKPEDIGLAVVGTGIASPCYVTARTNTVLTLDHACVTVDALTHTVTIGDPSATAPLNGETTMDQGVQLDLNPTLVAGSRPCTDESVEGFHVTATWNNPGTFIGGAFATQPAATKAVGQLQVKTSVITYGAYIIETPATGDAQIGVQHYDIVFPNVPTGLALCAATATSPKLGFSLGVVATTPSIAQLATGVGRPGTSQLRATQDNAQAGSTSTAFMVSDDIAHPWTGAQFSRLCIIPAGPPTVDFKCGTG